MTWLAASSGWQDAIALPVILVGVLCSVVAAELLSYGTKLGLGLVRLAVMLLEESERDRYREEWTRHVLDRSDEDRHNLTAIIWGLGTVFAAARTASARRHLLDIAGRGVSRVRRAAKTTNAVFDNFAEILAAAGAMPFAPPMIVVTILSMQISAGVDGGVRATRLIGVETQPYVTIFVMLVAYVVALTMIGRISDTFLTITLGTAIGPSVATGFAMALEFRGIGFGTGLLLIYIGGYTVGALVTAIGCHLNRLHWFLRARHDERVSKGVST